MNWGGQDLDTNIQQDIPPSFAFFDSNFDQDNIIFEELEDNHSIGLKFEEINIGGCNFRSPLEDKSQNTEGGKVKEENNSQEEAKEDVISTASQEPSRTDSETNQRGRPKTKIESSEKELLEYIINILLPKFGEIEDICNQQISEKMEKKKSRKREDALRCSVYRAISKISLWILEKLVSVGDRKHKDPQRLFDAYFIAFTGFKNIHSFIIHQNLNSDLMEDLANSAANLVKFSALHYSRKKVITVAGKFLNVDVQDLENLFLTKSNPSLKAIKKLKEHNEVLVHLVDFALQVIQYSGSSLPNCKRALLCFKKL
jgi:hypothetical protein